MIKNYPLILIAFLCFVSFGYAQYSGTGTFNKINSIAELTDGYYVITNQSDAFLMTNGRSGSDTTGYFTSTGITPASGVITDPTTSQVWRIETNGSGRTIYNEDITKYVGYVSGNSASIEDTPANSNRWTFSYGSSKFTVLNVNVTSRQLSYNSGAPRFAAYGNAGQEELQLYKLDTPTGPTVTYNGNGNTGGSVPTDSNNPYTSGDNVTVLGNTGSLTNTCSTFNNWNTAANGSGTSYSAGGTITNITANITLYAQWTSTANTVTFNSNGGSGTMTPQMDCTTANLTSNTFTNAGFTFNSWNTAANGSGTAYADGASYNFAADITLYAQWDVFVGPCLSDNFDSGYGNWTGGTGTYNNGTAGNTGNGIGFNTNDDDIITSTALSNPSSISFIARASGPTSNFTINIQYSTTSTGPWTNAISIVANGSNSGDITNSANTYNLALGLTGNYFLRIIQTPRSGGSFYLDDVDVYCGPAGPEMEVQGNGTEIVDGDSTPEMGDDTDFGATAVAGGTVTRTFTILNTGGADLTLNGTAPNYVTVTPSTEFTVSSQPALTTIPYTGGTTSTTFQITFDPTTLGPHTATVSIDNDDSDEHPYSFVIEGEGINSNTSDIIASGTYIYNSNIDYLLYQTATISNTTQSIDVFRVDIRDGGASNDSDSETTELTDITFNVTNLANIRTAALFDGNTLIDNSPIIGAGTISFSGFSQIAPDGGSASLTLRVTFLNTVTDNDQMEFAISSATANPTGSIFATTNAGGAVSSTINNRNRIEVIADRLNFLQQPSTTSTNAVMSPAVQVEATDINGNRDLDWTGNISITSTGTMTGDPISIASVSSVATFNSIVHTVAGTGLTLTATATSLLNDISAPFNIILFTFNSGDFRPRWATDLSYNGNWEYFNGSSWLTSAGSGWDGDAPQNTSTSINRILIDDYVTGGGSATNNYDCDILVLTGGTLELLENDNPPIASEFLSAGNTLEVSDGAEIIIRGDIDLSSSTNFIIRSGGKMTIDQNSMNNVHPIWDGVEKFEGGSIVEINDWDWGASATQRSLVNVANAITNNDNGYKFGNLYFNPTNLSNHWTIIGSGLNINVTENDFEINNNSTFYVLGMSNRTANISSTYGGNLIVTDGSFTFGGSFSNDTFDQNFLVLGNVIINSNDDFYVHHAFNGTPTITAGNSPVIIEGNLEIASTVNTVTSDVTTKEIVFSGDNTHTIEVAPNCSNVPFVIESGDTGILLNENLKFTGDSSLEIESGATFNFSFNGTTALEVQDISGARNEFTSQANSSLYITHPQGIWDSSTQGNVQDFGSTYTTYNQTANFYYIGKQNQVTGDALTVGSTVKNVYVILDTNTLELRLTNRTGISDGGKLEIQQGIVIGEEAGVNDNDFYGPDGQLIMTGGEYRISTITTNPLTDYLPQLRKYSSYNLTAGIVHLNGVGFDNTQILSGVPDYVNLSFSGSNILEGLPPIPPGLPTYKGISSAAAVSNNITISEDAIVDVKNLTLGGSGTNLIMEDQSRFIMAGSGTKPDATGNYTLGANTTIEFNNNGGFESIRLTNPVPSYANIVVSGDNVGTIADGSGPNSFIQFQANGSFMVTETGIFKQSNTNGFSGLVNTSISSTNNPIITLRNESTIEYQGANQTITAFTTNNFTSNDYYANVTISGTGLKSLGHPTDVLVGEDLNVNSSTLTIETDEAITVDESVNVTSGVFDIKNSGSLVQINDTSVNTGKIMMERQASIKNLDYVYWSSPITGYNVNNITSTNYIFKWDPTATNANNTQGNWLQVPNEIMEIGKGYIVRAPDGQTAPVSPGDLNFTSLFYTAAAGLGVPNNGEINVTINRGSNAISDDDIDDNWNLLGNPYPSSISAISFLNANNTSIDGFVNIWKHGLGLDSTIAPFYQNFTLSYHQSDYFYYNSAGSSDGPSSFTGFIAAGQSFMVSMNDGPNSASGNVVFNNAMRNKSQANNQFFRTSDNDTSSEEKHRIWLDLIVEERSTNRILIGYFEGATMARDRMYDAPFSLDDTTDGLYSLLDDDSYIIQGRSLPFNDTDIIPLGIKLTTSGSFHIAIASIDGLFETDNQLIYLKDNELGFTHNLSVSPYSFTSEAGEFNNRFEIVFTPDSLSVKDHTLDDSDLTIIELSDGDVQIKVNSKFTIVNVDIIDVTGRLIYALKGNSSTVTYDLSQLSKAAYVAKVTLSNGQVISKKAIKQH